MPGSRSPARKPAKPPKALTAYIVQRQFVPDGGDAVTMPELWQDVGERQAHSGTLACRLVANEDQMGGRYRAFPTRSDSRLDAEPEVQTRMKFTQPSAASVPKQASEPAT